LFRGSLSIRSANAFKRNQTPAEAFSHSPGNYDWQAMLARAQSLPANKRRKFAADAMDRYNNEERDFLARQLTDTAYLARIARQYLEVICPRNQIWNNSGQLTALLRNKWGLNRQLSDSGIKNRDDHRHHAIDALVIALTDRPLLQKVATASARADHEQLDQLIDHMPEPWNSFHATVAQAVSRIVVSHKPDHGPEGALHNDTAYGVVDTDAKGVSTVRHRVPLDSLDSEDKLAAIVDPLLRSQLQLATRGADKGKAIKALLEAYSKAAGVRRVRVEERLRVIAIKDRTDKIYKAYKGDGNYCYEIYRLDNGKWDGEVITSFEANQRNYKAFRKDVEEFQKQSIRGRSLVMRLSTNDTIAIDENGVRRLLRVVKLGEGQIALADLHEAGALKERHNDPKDHFRYVLKSPAPLQKLEARQVWITPLGYVHDPGFKP